MLDSTRRGDLDMGSYESTIDASGRAEHTDTRLPLIG
jgi:hypothetical protein